MSRCGVRPHEVAMSTSFISATAYYRDVPAVTLGNAHIEEQPAFTPEQKRALAGVDEAHCLRLAESDNIPLG